MNNIKWISVKDNLPKEEAGCFTSSSVVLATDGMQIYTGWFDIEEKIFYSLETQNEIKVLAWLPLTVLPKLL